MPRMLKYLKEECAFFLNDRGRKQYNDFCRQCEKGCKQGYQSEVIFCPKYLSKRRKEHSDDADPNQQLKITYSPSAPDTYNQVCHFWGGLPMNLFEAVKASISTREAADRYNIEIKRNGMACYPFHQNRIPSMKVDDRFHCFGYGADGDAIDFTARLYGLNRKAAAETSVFPMMSERLPGGLYTGDQMYNYTKKLSSTASVY